MKDMKKKNRFNIISAVLAAAVLCAGFCLSGTDVRAADMVAVTVSVSMKHEGGTVSVTGMEERDIPAGGKEDYVFTCTEPGTYTYKVKQTRAASGARMDTTVYELTIYAQYEEDTKTGNARLSASVYAKEQGKTDKKAQISFDNTIPQKEAPEEPKNPEPSKAPAKTGKNVKTGDESLAGAWSSILLMTLLGPALLICDRKRNERRKVR